MVATKWLPKRGLDEFVAPIDKVAAVKTAITLIINKEICERKETKLKKEYEAIFGPVPHYDDLPTDVEARIKLINPNKKIKKHNYACPRKYKDAWGILIEQHL